MDYWNTVSGEFVMLGGFVATGFLISFGVWWYWFHEDIHKHRRHSRWDGLRRKSDDEIYKEMALKLLREGAYGLAEEQFKILLGVRTDDPEVRLGLADSLLGQVEWGVRKDAGKMNEALPHFMWVLEHYLQTRKLHEAIQLYKRLLGPYSGKEMGEDIKSRIDAVSDELGTIIVHDGEDFSVHLGKLHQEFELYEQSARHGQAQSVVDDILKCESIDDIEPGFLARLGEIALRNNKDRQAERIFEQVAKRGDKLQTIRALEVMARLWMDSARRPRLAHLYDESAERFATIDESHEWVELGKKIRS